MEVTVLVSEIGGLGQAWWDFAPGEAAARLDRIFSAMTRTVLPEGSVVAHTRLTGISFFFPGDGHSARALSGAIRLIDLFRNCTGDFCGLNLRIGLDAGEISDLGSSCSAMVSGAVGVPFFVAADLVAKARANTVFLSGRVRDLAGDGFCFDEVNRARLRDYPSPLVSMTLCGRC